MQARSFFPHFWPTFALSRVAVYYTSQARRVQKVAREKELAKQMAQYDKGSFFLQVLTHDRPKLKQVIVLPDTLLLLPDKPDL